MMPSQSSSPNGRFRRAVETAYTGLASPTSPVASAPMLRRPRAPRPGGARRRGLDLAVGPGVIAGVGDGHYQVEPAAAARRAAQRADVVEQVLTDQRAMGDNQVGLMHPSLRSALLVARGYAARRSAQAMRGWRLDGHRRCSATTSGRGGPQPPPRRAMVGDRIGSTADPSGRARAGPRSTSSIRAVRRPSTCGSARGRSCGRDAAVGAEAAATVRAGRARRVRAGARTHRAPGRPAWRGTCITVVIGRSAAELERIFDVRWRRQHAGRCGRHGRGVRAAVRPATHATSTTRSARAAAVSVEPGGRRTSSTTTTGTPRRRPRSPLGPGTTARCAGRPSDRPVCGGPARLEQPAARHRPPPGHGAGQQLGLVEAALAAPGRGGGRPGDDRAPAAARRGRPCPRRATPSAARSFRYLRRVTSGRPTPS